MECEYEDLVNRTLLVDLSIFGLHLKSVQSALLKEDLTINKALQIARTEEAIRQHVEVIRSTRNDTQVDYVQKKRQNHRLKEHPPSQTRKPQSSDYNTKQCGNCGCQHDKGISPARGSICNKCGKYNHWAKLCRSGPKLQKPASRQSYKNVHDTRTEEHTSDEAFYFDTITIHATETRAPGDATQAFVDLKLGTSAYQEFFKCKIDTELKVTLCQTPYISAFSITQHQQACAISLPIR